MALVVQAARKPSPERHEPARPPVGAKLVTSVHQRRVSVVAISSKAIIRWGKDDPDPWKRVQGWLSLRGVRVVET